MKMYWGNGAAVFLLTAGLSIHAYGQERPGCKDLELIQGKWKPTMLFMRREGQKEFDYVPDWALGSMEFKIDGDQMVFKIKGDRGGVAGSGKIVLDSTKNPKTVDLIGKKGKTDLGIYEMEGDTLKLCIGDVAEGRPSDFAQKGRRFVVYLKRLK